MDSFQDEASWQRAIIENCVADNKTHGPGSGIFTCDLGSTTYKIKYGVSKALATRIATQLALYNAAQEANSIRIPRLVYHFDSEGRTYLVMEHIDFVQVSTSDMDNRIEYALRWLSCLRGDKLGPIEGGCILHGFFKDGEAPLAFKSVEALELYIAKVCVQCSSFPSRNPSSMIPIVTNLVFLETGPNEDPCCRPHQKLATRHVQGRTTHVRSGRHGRRPLWR